MLTNGWASWQGWLYWHACSINEVKIVTLQYLSNIYPKPKVLQTSRVPLCSCQTERVIGEPCSITMLIDALIVIFNVIFRIICKLHLFRRALRGHEMPFLCSSIEKPMVSPLSKSYAVGMVALEDMYGHFTQDKFMLQECPQTSSTWCRVEVASYNFLRSIHRNFGSDVIRGWILEEQLHLCYWWENHITRVCWFMYYKSIYLCE